MFTLSELRKYKQLKLVFAANLKNEIALMMDTDHSKMSPDRHEKHNSDTTTTKDGDDRSTVEM